MAQLTMIQAITDALAIELENDPNVLSSEKTLVKTAVYSVRHKDFRSNSAKTVCLILL